MMNKKRTIKTIALALACTMALPVNAFSLSDLWNKFKQNPQAKLVAGFSAATATIASLGYLAYKYWKKPATKATPRVVIPNNAQGTAAYQSAVGFGFTSKPASGLDPKHRMENLIHTDGTDFSDRVIPCQAAPRSIKPNSIATITKKSLQAKSDSYQKKKQNECIEQEDTIMATSFALGKQAAIAPKIADQGGKKDMGHNPMTILSMLKESNDAAAQRTDTLRNNAAQIASDAAINTALLELAYEEKAGAYMNVITTRLSAIEDALHDSNLSEQDRAAFIPELDVIRERFSSFGIEGTDFDKQYTDNFKRVLHLAGPKDAYKLLVTIELAESVEEARTMSIDEIRELLNEALRNPPSSFMPNLLQDAEARRNGTQTKSENFKWAIRQLDYIFRNDITREKYDAYIDGLPIVTIPREAFVAIIQKITDVKMLALEKPVADYEHIAPSTALDAKATQEYARSLALAKAQPLNPDTVLTKATRQAQHVIDAVNQHRAQQILDAIKHIEIKQKAANAAQTASSKLQAAGSAISAATSSVFSAAHAVGATAATYISTLASAAGKAQGESAVKQRPVIIIDHNAKQDQEVQPAAQAAASAYAQAAADKPANHPEDALVDNKPGAVINAGASIALAPEQPAQPVVIAQSGKAGDSTASLEAAAAQVSTISDSGASLAPALPEQGSAPAIVQVAQPMARPNGNASA